MIGHRGRGAAVFGIGEGAGHRFIDIPVEVDGGRTRTQVDRGRIPIALGRGAGEAGEGEARCLRFGDAVRPRDQPREGQLVRQRWIVVVVEAERAQAAAEREVSWSVRHRVLTDDDRTYTHVYRVGVNVSVI